MSRQLSLFASLKGKAPNDEILVIDKQPSQNRLESRSYEFNRGEACQFTWTKFRDGIFKNETRFFYCLPPWSTEEDTFSIERSNEMENLVPALKSQIQKAVRRCLPFAAVQAAWALLRQEPLELLRRLPIIMIEDKRAHEDLPLLIWGMLYFSSVKDWRMPIQFATRIIHIVWDLASCKDMVDVKRSLNDVPPEVEASKAKITSLLPLDRAIASCLLIRADHGGTSGDVDMLKRYAYWWAHEPITPIASSFGKFDAPLPDITMNTQWIPWTFDFHITKIIPWVLEEVGHGRVALELEKGMNQLQHHNYVRLAIWFYWSSVRYCEKCDKTDAACEHQIINETGRKLLPLWNLISPFVEQYAASRIGKAAITNKKRKSLDDPQPLLQTNMEKYLSICHNTGL
jgi:hypothetical protein